MKRTAVVFLIYLTTSFSQTLGQDIQAFGPWKIGMSKAEVESFTAYGPYETLPFNGDTVSVKSASNVEFLGKDVSATLFVKSDKVSSIQVNVLSTDSERDAIRTLKKSVDYLLGRLGRPLYDDYGDGREFGDYVKAHFESGRPGPYSYNSFGGLNYLRANCMKLPGNNPARPADSLYRVSIHINDINADPRARVTSNTRPTPPPGSTRSEPEPEEETNDVVLRDWSMSVPGGEGKFKRSLASIHALLVKPLGGGGHAAQAMKLSATAVPGNGSGLEFSFNQPVGSDMSRASEEVVRAIQVKHGDLPGRMDVEFGFADKWGGKDGPSAAVATALLIESMLGGFEIPATLAVTGDLNADQTVQPVGGVADKIRGAMDKGCLWIGVPAANEEDLNDLVVEENLRRFLTAKVFTLGKLDDAVLLANAGGRAASFTKAMADFEAIQQDLATGGAAALYSPQMQTRLNGVLEAVPNFYSAKVLHAASRKQAPSRYSLAGSLVRIDEAMAPYAETIAALRGGESAEKFQFGRNNPLSEANQRLNDLKRKSDPRLVGVITAQQTVIDRTQRLINANTKSSTVFEKLVNELSIASDRAAAQWEQIIDNQQIQDQLMKRGIQFE